MRAFGRDISVQDQIPLSVVAVHKQLALKWKRARPFGALFNNQLNPDAVSGLKYVVVCFFLMCRHVEIKPMCRADLILDLKRHLDVLT